MDLARLFANRPTSVYRREVDRFFSKIGISKGELKIHLDRSSEQMNKAVTGEITYSLKKPAEGKVLWVEVKATQRVTQPKAVRVRKNEEWTTEIQKSTSTATLFKKRIELDGHHLYDQGSYRFELMLPAELPQTTPNSDWVKAAEMVQAVFSGIPYKRGPVNWSIESKLEIPWSLGVSDKKSLEVRKPGAGSANSKAKFCGECGQSRRDGDKFCPNCGRRY